MYICMHILYIVDIIRLITTDSPVVVRCARAFRKYRRHNIITAVYTCIHMNNGIAQPLHHVNELVINSVANNSFTIVLFVKIKPPALVGSPRCSTQPAHVPTFLIKQHFFNSCVVRVISALYRTVVLEQLTPHQYNIHMRLMSLELTNKTINLPKSDQCTAS